MQKTLGRRRVKSSIKPLTRINVKPYFVIMIGSKILCEGKFGVPLVFDTRELAIAFAEMNNMDTSKYKFKKMELEELAHTCRDPRINFDSFYLINDKSQFITVIIK